MRNKLAAAVAAIALLIIVNLTIYVITVSAVVISVLTYLYVLNKLDRRPTNGKKLPRQ